MKSIIKLLLICLLTTTTLYAQYEWASSFGSSVNDSASSIDIDTSGNIYITGVFQETVDFDPGTAVTNLTSAGSTDVFVKKIDTSGNLIWAKSFGGTATESGVSIKLDTSGNLYITGRFEGTTDFDPGAGTTNLTPAGGSDVYVLKLDASGNFLWVRAFGGSSNERGASIDIDNLGNVYTTGYFEGTVDFNPEAGVENHTSAGGEDVFVQKLDASGNFLWAKTFGGTSNERGYSISIDASGNVYTTGYFLDTVDFDPGAAIANYTSAGGTDIFIHKLDTSGNFVWVKTIGDTSWDYGSSITVDASGNIYTNGHYQGIVDFDPGTGTNYLNSTESRALFVQKLDASGNFLWARLASGNYLAQVRASSIFVDASGDVYSTGYFEGTADFSPDIVGVGVLTSEGANDIFMQKLDASGNYVWAVSFGGTLEDYPGEISVDNTGSVYTVGSFQDTVDFDPEVGIANFTSVGGSDIFIHKMSQSTLSVIENSFGKELAVYPNPTNSDFSIDLDQVYENTNVSITDINGRLIDSKSFYQTQTIDFPFDASAGVYLVMVHSGEKKSVFKLVKQ